MLDIRESILSKGLPKTGITLDDKNRQQLLEYLDILAAWNKKMNLTAIRKPQAMVEKHVLDSLSVLPFITGKTVLDVGTGAGLPGIPLALIDTGRQYTLLDSRSKRIRFLFEVKNRLQIDNVTLVESRVEAYRPTQGFDTVISRAFSSLLDFSRLAGHCVTPSGRMLAMKAAVTEEELSAVQKPYIVATVHSLPVFDGMDRRKLVEIHKQ